MGVVRHVRLVVVNQMIDMRAGKRYMNEACCVVRVGRREKEAVGVRRDEMKQERTQDTRQERTEEDKDIPVL